MMKKILILSVALCGVLFALEIEATSNGSTRGLPTLKSEVIGKVSAGQKLEYETFENGWYKLKNGGYVSDEITKKLSKPTESKESVVALEISGSKEEAKKPTDVNENRLKNVGNNIQVIEDSAGYRFVDVSKTDITRIYCEAGEVRSVVFSKEKEIEIEQAGQNAFVKILRKITTTGEDVKVEVSDRPREAFLECGEKTYSLVMVPKDIPSQTIVLKSLYLPSNDVAKNTEKSSDYETTLSNLIKDAYKEKIPAGFAIELHNSLLQDFEELRLSKVKFYIGREYEVAEYALSAKKDLSLEEKTFLTYMQNPLAVSLEKLSLKKGESVRMFVVSRIEK